PRFTPRGESPRQWAPNQGHPLMPQWAEATAAAIARVTPRHTSDETTMPRIGRQREVSGLVRAMMLTISPAGATIHASAEPAPSTSAALSQPFLPYQKVDCGFTWA